MKWLLVTKQKRLKGIVLSEFKRKPQQVDIIPDLVDISQTEGYNRVIIGDDVWKQHNGKDRKKDKLMQIYYEMMGRSFRTRLVIEVVNKCGKCHKKGIRLECHYDSKLNYKVCKECRIDGVPNYNAKITFSGKEWIEETLKLEPTSVKVLAWEMPDELIKRTENVISTYFPEFKGIKIRFTSSALGMSLARWEIALNPEVLKYDDRAINHTIAHELTHQMCTLQGVLRGRSEQVEYLYDQQIPHGELQTEIWTFARHPDFVSSSYFYKIMCTEELKEKHGGYNDGYATEHHQLSQEHFIQHKDFIHELSKQALIRRKEGDIRYLKWYRSELKKIGIGGRGRTY